MADSYRIFIAVFYRNSMVAEMIDMIFTLNKGMKPRSIPLPSGKMTNRYEVEVGKCVSHYNVSKFRNMFYFLKMKRALNLFVNIIE